MALIQAGTTSTTALNGFAWNAQSPAADLASVANAIKKQTGMAATRPIQPGAFTRGGQLYFPSRRGVLNLVPGDYILYDSYGWPIVISYESIAAAGTSWSHT